MTGKQYQQRLQRALDYIEKNLESKISLEDLAAEACYSSSHFVWIFSTVIGQTPMEYVRRRRVTEAARAIFAGDDIVDTVYRFGFSAQDSFTRSFKRNIGLTPGRLKQSSGVDGTFTPAFNLEQKKGGGKMLNYNLDCDPLESILRVEHLMTDKVMELIARIAAETVNVRAVDPRIIEELIQARVIRNENDMVRIDTALFFENDLVEIHDVANRWGTDLAKRIDALDERLPQMSPECKRLIVGMNGIDQGVFDLLISGGYAFNHRATTGRYAGAKIDLYEVCDEYDSFGPYLSGGYGVFGERFAMKIIGQDQGIYRFLTSGISETDDEQYSFRTNVNKYLVDALGGLLLGESNHPLLAEAAESASLMKTGKAVVPVITEGDASEYWKAARLVRDSISKFLSDNATGMKTFLRNTVPGKSGVPSEKLIVDLMRYVRMVTHKSLYASRFYTDSLPEGGNITIFRELAARIDGR